MKYLSHLADIELESCNLYNIVLPVFHIVCKVTDSPKNRVAIVQR